MSTFKLISCINNVNCGTNDYNFNFVIIIVHVLTVRNIAVKNEEGTTTIITLEDIDCGEGMKIITDDVNAAEILVEY